MGKHILLVDDDDLLRKSLGFNLTQAGFRSTTAESAEAGLELAKRDPPALILLDVGLPGMNGFEALSRFREQIQRPVIFLTGHDGEMDHSFGLASGAEDYIVKPFSFVVLLARINVVLRRLDADSRSRASVLQAGDLRIDLSGHQVTINGRAVELRHREFEVLLFLAEHMETIVPSVKIIEQVWGTGFMGEPQVLYVTISRLREKLEEDPEHPKRILSLRGIGYRLVPQPEELG